MEQKRPAQRLWELLQLDRQEIKNIYFYAIISGIVSLSLPLGVQAIIGFIQAGQISTSWTVLVVGVVAGVLATGLLQILQLRITEGLQQKIFIRNAFEFANIIPKADWKSYSGRLTELMNRFLDTTSVQKGISKLVLDFSSSSLQIIFGLILLSFYHSFFVVMGVLFLSIFVITFRYHFKEGLKTSLIESKYKYQMLAWLEEMAANIPMVKVNIHSDFHLQKTDKIVISYLDSREKHFKVLRKKYFSLIAFKLFIISCLLVVGGILVINQSMNMGQFIAAEIIVILLMSSVEKLMNILEVLYDVLTSLEKLGKISDLTLEKQVGIVFPLIDNFSNFTLTVPVPCRLISQSGKKEILEDLFIQKGDRVLLKGNKKKIKELMESLAGLNRDNGKIKFNEILLNDFLISDYRKNVYYSRERADVFEGTIMENLSLNNEQHTLQSLNEAVQISGLSDDIAKLKGGLHYRLQPGSTSNDNELNIKIGLARSIMTDSPIFLLNNSFLHLSDKDGQFFIQEILKRNNTGCIVLFTEKEIDEKLFNKIVEIR
jgi:ABC-type bacteriocin/lantibiotic exporter with double-glycine peptidase domain